MKRRVLILSLCLICLKSTFVKASGNITFIEPGTYQIAYPNQVIFIYFNQSNFSGSAALIETANLNEKEHYAIARTLKEQIDLLPQDFIREYLNSDIFLYHIIKDSDYSFYQDNQIVVDVDKIRPGLSYKQSINSSLMREIALTIVQQQFRDEETKALINYLNDFHHTHFQLIENYNTPIYQKGYVTIEASGKTQGGFSATTEIAELFSHLTCTESRTDIISFVNSNPSSFLNKKINRFIEYLEHISPSFDKAYFFGEAQEETSESTTSDLNGKQLLTAHEVKSNEAFDFTFESMEDNLEVSMVTIPADFKDQKTMSNEHSSHNFELEDKEVETVFKSNKKSKKKKKKKNGSGKSVFLIGGLILLLLLIGD